MLADVLDRLVPGRSQYLHRAQVVRQSPAATTVTAAATARPPTTRPSTARPHSYHGGGVAGLKTSGLKLANKFFASSKMTAAVRRRTSGGTAIATDSGFSDASHTWRFKRLRYTTDVFFVYIQCVYAKAPRPYRNRPRVIIYLFIYYC